MVLHTKGLLVFLTVVINANAQCLKEFDVTAESCSYDALAMVLQEALDADPLCTNKDVDAELESHFGTIEDAKEIIQEACAAAYVPFSAITDKGHVFDKEYFDGGTYYNGERESINEYGITINKLENDPGSRITDIYNDLAQTNGISWPGNLSNFKEESCELNAAMCCFTQDRQANDNNGNCAAPYDENCVDADPADNTDVCYVDMERAPTSSRTKQGYAIFEKNAEEDSHCHGFAWAEDPNDSSARFKANKLFFVSMYDHLTQRGYAKSVPGAPMCACIEQMPIVTRADCTQVDIEQESATFSLSNENVLTATITDLKIEFNSCQGADNNNNDLEAYYQRLVAEGKISSSKMETFGKTIVGKTYCPEAIDSFLNEKGLVAKPECKYGDPSECGCKNVNQMDYRGNITVTTSGLECQRWDAQTPHSHSRTRQNYPDANLVENYCRNPDNEPGGAWCYTTDPNVRWDYCDVPVCGVFPTPSPTPSPTTEDPYPCSMTENGSDYRGKISETEEGDICQAWDSQSPHSHSRTPEIYPDADLTSNYCRNPDGEPRPWCYTTNPNKRWRYCNVPRCEESGGTRQRRNLRVTTDNKSK